MVAALTAFTTRYTIHLADHKKAEFDALKLSRWERAERLLWSKIMLSTTPSRRVPLVFKKRTH